MKKSKRESGGAGMKRTGRHPILLGVTEADWWLLREAASAARITSVTQFLVRHGLAAAKEILEKKEKKEGTAIDTATSIV